MTGIDLKIFISFMTFQLLLGSFLSQTNLNIIGKTGFIFIDISISIICVNLLRNNYKRRIEVVGTIKNCNEYLGFGTKDVYIENKELNASTKFRPWFWLYMVAIGVSCAGVIILMFSESELKPQKPIKADKSGEKISRGSDENPKSIYIESLSIG